eukprot:890619-Prymnesium_polylepis.1
MARAKTHPSNANARPPYTPTTRRGQTLASSAGRWRRGLAPSRSDIVWYSLHQSPSGLGRKCATNPYLGRKCAHP